MFKEWGPYVDIQLGHWTSANSVRNSTQPSRCKRAESNLIADEKGPYHLYCLGYTYTYTFIKYTFYSYYITLPSIKILFLFKEKEEQLQQLARDKSNLQALLYIIYHQNILVIFVFFGIELFLSVHNPRWIAVKLALVSYDAFWYNILFWPAVLLEKSIIFFFIISGFWVVL